jgi:hypothetical protein
VSCNGYGTFENIFHRRVSCAHKILSRLHIPTELIIEKTICTYRSGMGMQNFSGRIGDIDFYIRDSLFSNPAQLDVISREYQAWLWIDIKFRLLKKK